MLGFAIAYPNEGRSVNCRMGKAQCAHFTQLRGLLNLIPWAKRTIMKLGPSNRSDISLALIHLTGYRNGRLAIDLLMNLLSEQRIRASGNEGYIKGMQSAVCFTEMPLSSVHRLVESSRCSGHPYSCYGVALHKSHAFSRGARPVIYLPDDEAAWIPPEQKWRHVRFEHGEVDFTHEREWRSPGDFLLTGIGFYVIVGSRDCENRIRSYVPSVSLDNILGFIHMETICDFL